MTKPLVCFGDFDSLCYAAGRCELEEDMRITIHNAVSTVIKRCGTDKIAAWVEVCENKFNFRNHVATTRPYKGNRKGKVKPPLLNAAKHYMVEQGYARWCNYIESEDKMLIEANKYGIEHSIFSYIDKDCRQQHGRVYDYKKDELYEITPDEAALNFYMQVLTGDSTDNIVGIMGTGFRKQIVVDAKKKLLTLEQAAMPLFVAQTYAKCEYSYDYLVEQCRLLYLLRKAHEVYTYPIERAEYELLGNL